MKKIFVLLVLLIISGCLFPTYRSMRSVVSSLNDYSISIKKECDATQIGKVMPDVASLFVEFGCDSCLIAEFRKNSGKMTVEMVSFLKSKGAMGAYLSTDIPGSNPVDIGYKGRKSSSAIEFLKGKHIVMIRPENESGITEAQKLADLLEKRIPGDAIKPDVYEVLPHTQMIDGSELYFAGPKTFGLGFSSDLAKVLRIAGAVEGAAAEYIVDDARVVFIMIRFAGRSRTLDAVNYYLDSRKDRPIIRPGESLEFYTIIEPDQSETYIAENGDWLYLLMDGPYSGRAQSFFQYVLRGGR